MRNLRELLAKPLAAVTLCAVLIVPARFVGQEAGLVLWRLVDHVVSRFDMLFEVATSFEMALVIIRTVQAWGSWFMYGAVTAIVAMGLTRWLAMRPLPWRTVVMVLVIWIGIYLLLWNADSTLRPDLPDQGIDHWSYAGPFGFFGGFIAGLVLAAAPWRLGNVGA